MAMVEMLGATMASPCVMATWHVGLAKMRCLILIGGNGSLAKCSVRLRKMIAMNFDTIHLRKK